MPHQYSALSVDESTGFLESKRADAFNAQDKVQFVEYYKKGIPIYKVCAILNMDRYTFSSHYQGDPVFKRAIDDCHHSNCDELEKIVYQNARRKQGVQDRHAYLRAYRPERWAPKYESEQNTITINLNGDNLQASLSRAQTLDAELVKPKELSNISNVIGTKPEASDL